MAQGGAAAAAGVGIWDEQQTANSRCLLAPMTLEAPHKMNFPSLLGVKDTGLLLTDIFSDLAVAMATILFPLNN